MIIKMSKKIDLTSYHYEIVQMFSYECKTDKQIKEYLGNICSTSVITRYRHKNNIDRIYKNYNWLKRNYEKGLSSLQIANLCGACRSEIQKYLKEYNIVESKKRTRYNINKDYFSEYTSNNCYWAGFICADGHIENYIPCDRKVPNYKLKILLSKKDEDHLIHFVSELGYTKNILRYRSTSIRNKTHDSVSFSSSIKKICTDLNENFDIQYGNKSCKEVFSGKVPNEFVKDFIRGHFDGDGSVYTDKNKKQLRIAIVAGKDFLIELKKYLSNQLGKDIGHIYKERENDLSNSNNGLYKYCIMKKEHVRFFYNFIYYDNCIALERKRNVFENFYNKI